MNKANTLGRKWCGMRQQTTCFAPAMHPPSFIDLKPSDLATSSPPRSPLHPLNPPLEPSQITWRPPSKNAERISSYKVMLANSAGAVREVYLGKDVTARAGGLRPNSEYVFAVKATYDDGSHLWSESKAFRTRVA